MNFVRRFRVVARKSIYFHKRVHKLGPGYYNCPSDCTRKQADMRNGCPTCEYMIQWNGFKAECEKEIAKNSPGPQADIDWPVSLILHYLNDVSTFDTQVRGKGYNPNWTVTTLALIGVYRDELQKSRAEDDWNREQEAKAQARSGAPRSRAKDDSGYLLDYD